MQQCGSLKLIMSLGLRILSSSLPPFLPFFFFSFLLFLILHKYVLLPLLRNYYDFDSELFQKLTKNGK